MSDETTMAQFNTEGKEAFPVKNEEKENSAESPTAETPAESTPSPEEDKSKAEDKTKAEEDDKNFADHPRWKEREQDWTKRFNEQEVRHTQEIEKIRKDIEDKFSKKREDLADADIPSWFGGDAEQWAQYKAHEDARLAEAEERAIKRLESKAEKEQEEIKKATDYFNETVATIESDKTINPDGIKVDRNKLLKFVMDNDLVDSKGRWNYKAGFQMMKGSQTTAKTDTIDEKKKIAGASVTGDKAETKAPQYTSSDDFKKPGARPW